MKIFTIENDTNNITVRATVQDAEAVANAERFRNEAGLAKLAANWPSARLVAIWNSLPGATPVKKFTDRKKAVARIWTAIQNLAGSASADVATVPEQRSAEVAEISVADAVLETAVTVAPEEATPANVALPALDTPVAPQTPDVAPAEPPATKKGHQG